MAESADTGWPAFGQPLGRAVFFGGPIRTLRPDRPLLEAVGVAGGRIVCTGSRAEVQSRLTTGDGRRPRPVDLKGLALFPGLVDAHTHLGSYGLRLDWVDLDGVASLEEACGIVARAAAGAAPGKWVRGGGWNKNLWPGGRLPTRADLDRAAPGNPVALSSKDGHALWLNSEALRRAGITRDTPDPPGGEIVRDRSGEPTGILKEKAMDLGYRVVEQPSPEEYAACLERAARLANAHGLVGVHDMEGRSSFRACQALAAAGRLSLRVWMYLPAEHLGSLEDVGLEGGFGGLYLTVAGVKAFLDGALGSQTADLLRPYEGGRDHGLPTMQAEAFTDLVARAVRARLPVAVHAIGDRANRKALDAFEANLGATRAARLRHRIEHAQLVHPDDIPRFGRLGVVASMQPIHAPSDRDMAERYWGARCATAYAWRSLADAGAELAFGSDVPVETLDPIQGLYAAVTRKHPLDPGREAWYPEQALTLPEALWAYTGGAAGAVGAEREMGTIEVGKRADFTVLSDDVLADGFDPEALLQVRVVATVVGGNVVHGHL
jgi:hypothetical protein